MKERKENEKKNHMYVFFFEKNGEIKKRKREEKKWSKEQNKGKTKIKTKKNKKKIESRFIFRIWKCSS